MRNAIITGGIALSASVAFGGFVLWPEQQIDYKPTILTGAQIEAEKKRICEKPSKTDAHICAYGDNSTIYWKISAIHRICSEKTSDFMPNGYTGNIDFIGASAKGVAEWRCQSQFAAINGNDLKGWDGNTRPRALQEAWSNLRSHRESYGLFVRPAEFARATVSTVRFSLGK